MDENGKVQGKKKRTQGKAKRRAGQSHGHCYPFELRRRAVQLCLEEGFPVEQVARELGVGFSTIGAWVRRYRAQGEAGLQAKARPRSPRPQVAAAVKRQAIELKQRHPDVGIRKISQFLRRVLFLPVSRETVRRTLHEHQLLKTPRPKPQRNPPRPRFFERATPNQLWQTDIFTFRLGGKNAYLIGFLDDHSRYVVGLDVFRSQTAEHVLEVYRRAVAEYGVPKEMLSDQGRQYSSWRGTTRFEAELRKDRVHHLKSRPHHPMTLGKIERFWKTIWEEFLARAQFDSFESAGERVRLWVKYYNHRRPHQSLEGLCPADRFFGIAKELRQVIEKGIQENVLELALRGEPKSPFYMVGRLGEQSVVIRAEKGRVKMLVDGEEPRPQQQVSYDLEGGGSGEHGKQSQEGAAAVYCPAARAGGAVALDRAPAPGGPLPGARDHAEGACPVGDAGTLGYAEGAGSADAARTGPRAEPETGAVAGAAGPATAGAAGPAGEAAGQAPGAEGPTAAPQVADPRGAGGRCDERSDGEPRPARPGPAAGAADHAGAERGADGRGGGPATGDLPQDLLQVGAPGASGDGRGPGQSGSGAPAAAARSGEGSPPAPDGGAPGEAHGPGADGADPAAAGAAG
jgi:transposase InsO family protein